MVLIPTLSGKPFSWIYKLFSFPPYFPLIKLCAPFPLCLWMTRLFFCDTINVHWRARCSDFFFFVLLIIRFQDRKPQKRHVQDYNNKQYVSEWVCVCVCVFFKMKIRKPQRTRHRTSSREQFSMRSFLLCFSSRIKLYSSAQQRAERRSSFVVFCLSIVVCFLFWFWLLFCLSAWVCFACADFLGETVKESSSCGLGSSGRTASSGVCPRVESVFVSISSLNKTSFSCSANRFSSKKK